MGLFSKIKELFFKKNSSYRLADSSNTDKAIKLALKEKNPESVMKILENNGAVFTSEEITCIIKKLPINKRVEAMKLVSRYITPYDLFDLINNNLDGVNKLIALKEFQNQLDLYDIYTIFDNLSPDRRTDALDLCIDRFDSFSTGEVIKNYIPLAERADALYKYDELIDSFSKVDIIKKLSPDETILALDKYVQELSATSIYEIVSSLPVSHVVKGLQISYNYLSQNQIRDIIMYNVPEPHRLDVLKECSEKLDISVKTDIIKYSMNEEDKQNAIIDLEDYLDSDHVFDIVQDLKLSAKFLKVLSSKFGISENDIK